MYEYVMSVIDVSTVEKDLGVSQELRFEFFFIKLTLFP
jgi:hypothetical protein